MSNAIFYHPHYPEGFSQNFPDDLLDGRPLYIPIVREVVIGAPNDLPDVAIANKVMFEFASYEERGREIVPVYKSKS